MVPTLGGVTQDTDFSKGFTKGYLTKNIPRRNGGVRGAQTPLWKVRLLDMMDEYLRCEKRLCFFTCVRNVLFRAMRQQTYALHCLGIYVCKTIVVETLRSEHISKSNGVEHVWANPMQKQLLFNMLERNYNKTNCVCTCLNENKIKPMVFNVFNVLDQTRP